MDASATPPVAVRVRRATVEDAERISRLIHGLSASFLLSPHQKGAEAFLKSIGEQAVRGYIQADRYAYLVAEAQDELVGLVALRDNSHLYHLFVAPAYQGKGLGRRLWERVKQASLQAGHPGRFTVNSSLSAVPVYERFGFVATGPKVETNGVAFVPMELREGTLVGLPHLDE